jgi:hypothetical protein
MNLLVQQRLKEAVQVKVKGIQVDEVPDTSDDYWLTRDGQFVQIRDHLQLVSDMGLCSVDDLYNLGFLRVVLRGEEKEVWLNATSDPPNLTPKQQQAIDTLQNRDYRINVGDYVASYLTRIRR